MATPKQTSASLLNGGRVWIAESLTDLTTPSTNIYKENDLGLIKSADATNKYTVYIYKITPSVEWTLYISAMPAVLKKAVGTPFVAATPQVITHGLGTLEIVISLWQTEGPMIPYADWTASNRNATQVTIETVNSFPGGVDVVILGAPYNDIAGGA